MITSDLFYKEYLEGAALIVIGDSRNILEFPFKEELNKYFITHYKDLASAKSGVCLRVNSHMNLVFIGNSDARTPFIYLFTDQLSAANSAQLAQLKEFIKDLDLDLEF